VRSAFREVWEAIDALRSRELNLKSARVRGARPAQSDQGFVTLGQMKETIAGLRATVSGLNLRLKKLE